MMSRAAEINPRAKRLRQRENLTARRKELAKATTPRRGRAPKAKDYAYPCVTCSKPVVPQHFAQHVRTHGITCDNQTAKKHFLAPSVGPPFLSPCEQDAVVAANANLAQSIPRHVLRYSWDDLPGDAIGEANLGLIIAAARFDPSRGVSFATYASYWVRRNILDWLLGSVGASRVGRTAIERAVFFGKGKYDDNTLAEKQGVDEEQIAVIRTRLNALTNDSRSIDDPQLAWAPPSHNETPEKYHVRHALKSLDAQSRFVIEALFLSEEPATLQEIGEHLELSKQRIAQIKSEALPKLERAINKLRRGF